MGHDHEQEFEEKMQEQLPNCSRACLILLFPSELLRHILQLLQSPLHEFAPPQPPLCETDLNADFTVIGFFSPRSKSGNVCAP